MLRMKVLELVWTVMAPLTVSVAALLVATFLPFPFVHPLRVRRLRGLTLALLLAWAILALFAIVKGMKPDVRVTVALCVIALYVLTVGALRKSA